MACRLRLATVVLLLAHAYSTAAAEEAKKTDDTPTLSVKLGQSLVARRNDSNGSMFMEGGKMNTTSTLAPSNDSAVTNKTYTALPAELGTMSESWPNGHDKNSTIKARKGVSASMDEAAAPPVACACCVNITSQAQLEACACCHVELKTNTTTPAVITKPVTDVSNSTTVKISSTAGSTPLPPAQGETHKPVIHRQKPNVTADAPDQQTPPKQEDYVIPVVGIIFAIPLIIILGALVYKKGADLWERRHYRRMDFLIDGIYNQ